MTKITIDIDKPYNDRNLHDAGNHILHLGDKYWETIDYTMSIDYRRSAHDRLHVDVEFPDDMYWRITEELDGSTLEDMYFILFRLAAGDDIRRLRTDAKKFFKGEDIFHWLPSKDDYRKVAEREK